MSVSENNAHRRYDRMSGKKETEWAGKIPRSFSLITYFLVKEKKQGITWQVV